ncbi:MAG: sigma-54-dependent Fis family transcriptional regulator [Lautropia sp.]
MRNYATVESSGVESARRRFVEEGVAPKDEVGPVIARSWQRCRPFGLDERRAEPVSRVELVARREAAGGLLRCAAAELDAVAEQMARHDCIAILSDATGLILDEAGSADFLPRAERVALLPGVEWSEGRRGTNAIGTALAERAPVLVRGPEHLLGRNGGLGCAAAPILDGSGAPIGVLDVSGDHVRIDGHALGLVRLAAAQIEHRLLRRSDCDEILHFHRRAELLDTACEGLVIVTGGRIAGLNRVALGLLGGGDWRSWLDDPVERLFGHVPNRALAQIRAPNGQQWFVAVERREPGRRTPASRGDSLSRIGDVPSPMSAAGREHRLREEAASGPVSDDPLSPLLERATRVLDAGLPVLIVGETGSGKDWFARRLHAASRRAGGPLISVNCAALPESLIEAELFGYEEGAFTGARRRGLPGRVREAHRGVLFLDEIGDMPMSLQTRLLRVLEEHRVRPLGAARDVEIDFDFVCATHRDLFAMAREGRFREDLLYRLNGFLVTLPPLRARADRRGLILRLFHAAVAERHGLTLSEAALDALERREWRGNVRELLSVLGSVVALAERGAVIRASDLPPAPGTVPAPADSATPVASTSAPSGADPDAEPLSVLTQQAIDCALSAHGGRIAPAARSLGVHRSTLYRRLGGGRRRP